MLGALLLAAGSSACTPGGEQESTETRAQPLTAEVEWPNASSATNGDAWLRANHERVQLLKPRVLVLHADKRNIAMDTLWLAQEVAERFQEASRYHGYATSTARILLDYQLRLVNLANNDTASTPWPASWPVAMIGGRPVFQPERMFETAFAAALGIKDPNDSTRFLTLCELFERGIINEVWTRAPSELLADGSRGDSVGVVGSKSRAQIYDAAMNPVPGSFNPDAGQGRLSTGTAGQCKVTVRFLELSDASAKVVRAATQGMEGLARSNAIPYFTRNSERFFNFNLKSRYGLPFYSQSDVAYCPQTDATIEGYVSPDFPINADALVQGFFVWLEGTKFMAQTDAHGYFRFENVPPKAEPYVLHIAKSMYLTRSIQDVTVRGPGSLRVGSASAPVLMWGGDVNEDGAINMSDFMFCSGSLNKAPTDPAYNNDCDVNRDGAVNAMDYSIMMTHNNTFAGSYPAQAIAGAAPGSGCGNGCYRFPDAHTIAIGACAPNPDNRISFSFASWGQGCGSVDFPPGARAHHDWDTAPGVLTTCEYYGMRNGTGGMDRQTPFYADSPTMQEYEFGFGVDNAWAFYLMQSMPGWGNSAFGVDGKPMKSWLPFMYY